MNYKQMRNALDEKNGELRALKEERDHLIEAEKRANRSARYQAKQRGIAEGRLRSLSELVQRAS